MTVARHPVTELWVQRQGSALVRVGSGAPTDAEKSDLRTWVDRSALPAPAMLVCGLALGLSGVALAIAGPGGLALSALFSGMITLGGGMTFLALVKRKNAPAPRALTAPSTSPEVARERARRVHATLADGGDATFELLLRHLGWTEAALLETLVQMKESGAVEEDLNLDTGEWVYRAHHDVAPGGALMLDDRKANADAQER
jgi:hypothetical protein